MEAIHKKLQYSTLLIAEDDPSTLRWLIRVLSLYFKSVKGAKDAMEALEIFQKEPTDVVIADIQMPEVDGLNFLQKIASISPDTLRITMTAFNDQLYVNRAVEAEVNFYFKKPIDLDELLIAISTNISKKPKNVENTISLGFDYIYDFDQKIVLLEKKKIKLTKKEVLLLELLIKNSHTITAVEEIESKVWKEATTVDAIRMVVVGLRKKLYGELIENVKGLGYKINLI